MFSDMKQSHLKKTKKTINLFVQKHQVCFFRH